MILFANDSILVGVEEWLNIIPILSLDVDFEIGAFDLDVVKGMIEGSIIKVGLNLALFIDRPDFVRKGLSFNDVSKYWDSFNKNWIISLNVGSKIICIVGFSDVLPVGNADSLDDSNVEGWTVWTSDGSDI